MVRILLRPCASALAGLKRQSTPLLKSVAVRSSVQSFAGQDHVTATRFFSSGKDKKGSVKHTLHDKFNDEAVVEEIPVEVEFLSKEIDEKAVLDETIAAVVPEVAEEEEDDDAVLSAEEWAAKFEEEIANWDNEDGDFEDLEDDRIQIEMPNHDPSLLLSEDSSDDVNRDLFNNLEPGMAMGPEMLNWMLPKDQREVFNQSKEKPWKYFVKADHQDVVELALDVELLRLFISPTGRIRPRRFTGLTAKQQRKLARAVKVSRQMALLPFLSRYPDPSPDQWKALEEEEIAKLMAEAANDDGKDVIEDDDDFEDME